MPVLAGILTDMSRHNNLKQWRDLSGMTQKALGARLVPVVSQVSICRWEAGVLVPTISQATQIDGISGGRVPATSWGYEKLDIQRLRENTKKR